MALHRMLFLRVQCVEWLEKSLYVPLFIIVKLNFPCRLQIHIFEPNAIISSQGKQLHCVQTYRQCTADLFSFFFLFLYYAQYRVIA